MMRSLTAKLVILTLLLTVIGCSPLFERPEGQKRLRFFKIEHRALGNASLTRADGILVVHNIGLGGKDGVAIDLREARRWEVEWLDLQPIFPLGGLLRITIQGQVDGVAGRRIGSSGFVKVSSTIKIYTDFAPIGSITHRIEFYRKGTQVGVWAGQSKDVPIEVVKGGLPVGGHIRAGPLNICYELASDIETKGACFIHRWNPDNPVQVAYVSSPVDEIRIMAENPFAEVDFFTNVSIQAGGIPQIAITKESVLAVDEPDPPQTCSRDRPLQIERVKPAEGSRMIPTAPILIQVEWHQAVFYPGHSALVLDGRDLTKQIWRGLGRLACTADFPPSSCLLSYEIEKLGLPLGRHTVQLTLVFMELRDGGQRAKIVEFLCYEWDFWIVEDRRGGE
jgi:hypothetical protein